MLSGFLTGVEHIYIATGGTDFRKQAESLFSGFSITHKGEFEEVVYDLNTPEFEVSYGVDYIQYVTTLIAGFQYHDSKITTYIEQLNFTRMEVSHLKHQLELLTLKLDSIT